MPNKMAGTWAPIYKEVSDILKNLHPYAFSVYNALLELHLKEDWDQPGEWVIATTTEKVIKSDIIRNSVKKRDRFYRIAWPLLLSSGLVIERDDGKITITKYKKKSEKEKRGHQSLSNIEKRINLIEKLLDEIKSDINELKISKILNTSDVSDYQTLLFDEKQEKSKVSDSQTENGNTQEKVSDYQTHLEKKVSDIQTLDHQVSEYQTEVSDIQTLATTSIDQERDLKISLSLISLFYSTIGQTKISKEKRERALKSFEEMRKEGFTDDEIEFAVKWIPENAKEKPYDFAIVPNMIGQALAARDEYEKKERRQAEKEAEKALHEEEERKSSELKDHSRLVKERMTPDERKELKQKAIESLEAQGMKKQFITQMLIEAEENKILMESGVIDHEDQS